MDVGRELLTSHHLHNQATTEIHRYTPFTNATLQLSIFMQITFLQFLLQPPLRHSKSRRFKHTLDMQTTFLRHSSKIPRIQDCG